jgi:hypothetical protein
MQFAGREAIWKFNSIMLPDSSVSRDASIGFVTFGIKPVQGLPQGTQITNTGTIYFDYNQGVTTNPTVNTIDYTLSVKDLEQSDITITIMPNPFNQFTSIKIDGAEGTYELKVYDMLGNLVRTAVTSNNTFGFERNNLSPGVYMYEIRQQNKVIGKGKMVAE